MDTPRLDYSELVFALQENKEGRAAELLEELLPRLKDYLKVTMNATDRDAEECIHQTFFKVYEQIMQDNIRKEKYIFSYLVRTCKHEYIRYMRRQHRFSAPIEDASDYLVEPADQVSSLLDEERQQILEECLAELDKKSRAFIEYFFSNPDATTKAASKHLKLSGANVRTRKSRIIDRLHYCFKRKWEK